MEAARPRILIAAPVDVIRQLAAALGDDVEVTAAPTWSAALAELRRNSPALLIVCYVFDEMRPFRLLHYVRHEWEGVPVPVLLVRALPVPLGQSQETEIRESYRTLGVDEFINLNEEARRDGLANALSRFRDEVYRRLPLLEK